MDFLALRDRHGIFREIPTEYEHDATSLRVFEIAVESVTDGGALARTFATDRHGANLQVKIGDADRIVTGKQTYSITYRVRGALEAYADHDELYWNVNGAEWPVPTGAVGLTVRLASGGFQRFACFQGVGGSREPCRMTAEAADTAAFVTTRVLAPGEQLTAVTGLRKGAVAEPRPIYRAKPRGVEDWFGADPVRAGAALVVLVGGIGLVLRHVRRHGRDDTDGRADVLVPEYEPPERLRPAHLGLLIDERADPLDLTATIVDLARRGHLRIEEKARQGFLGGVDWTLTRLEAAPPEGEYERILLEGLFAKGGAVALSTLKGTFSRTLDRAQRALYRESVSRGWFPTEPDRVRAVAAVAAVGLVLCGLVATVGLGLIAGAGLAGLAVVPSGALLLALSPAMSKRTAAGHALAERTRGFRHYMEIAESDRQRFAEKASLFTEYLPYAIVFGCVERWARAFRDVYGAGTDTTSAWYGGSAMSAAALSSSLQGFSSQVSSAIASAPSGSGFSGGSSGGGGGGGGGGSW